MKSVFISACVGMLAIVISACTDEAHSIVDSSAVDTSAMSAETHVSYAGSQYVTIEVMLREGAANSNTDINLISGDALKASTVGDPSNLSFSNNLFDNLAEISNQVVTLQQGTRRVYNDIISGTWYYATTDAKYREKEYTVALLRGNRNDAPNSVVRLPPDFSLGVNELANTSVLSRSGDITDTWDLSGNANPPKSYTMEITAFVNCSNGTANDQTLGSVDSGQGSYTIAANTFNYSGDCIITIGVESWTLGTADPALHPSSFIKGHQYRTIAIATVD